LLIVAMWTNHESMPRVGMRVMISKERHMAKVRPGSILDRC